MKYMHGEGRGGEGDYKKYIKPIEPIEQELTIK